ncbi:uncharacterized protein [Miscanthus floridulus]|uniref:uncharacterized protein n=1 Tax=Miscanthus floridulus TaxID=154761 RepID=UPI00345ADF8D
MALAPDANSQELDGRALYTIGRGMKHGRVPIGDGVVDKAIVLAHSKSVSVRPPDLDHYESVLQENAQLKTNNDILAEENRIHRELFKSVFDRIGVEPPAELLQRLQDLDACHHQATGSHGGSHSVDERRSNDNADDEDDDDDYSYHESDDDDCSYHQGNIMSSTPMKTMMMTTLRTMMTMAVLKMVMIVAPPKANGMWTFFWVYACRQTNSNNSK